MSRKRPAHWNKPYVDWTPADWKAEGTTKSEFAEVQRTVLVDRAMDLVIHPDEETVRAMTPVAADAFADAPQTFNAFAKAWLDEQNPIWDSIDDSRVAMEIQDQVENASRDQILGYACHASRV